MPKKLQDLLYGTTPGLSGSSANVTENLTTAGANNSIGEQPIFGSDGVGDSMAGSSLTGGIKGSCDNPSKTGMAGAVGGPEDPSAPNANCMTVAQYNSCFPEFAGPNYAEAGDPHRQNLDDCPCEICPTSSGNGSESSDPLMGKGGSGPASGSPSPFSGGGFGGQVSASGKQSLPRKGGLVETVDLQNGAVSRTIPLASIPNLGRGFQFKLSHNSQDNYLGPVSQNWRHNFEMKLELTPTPSNPTLVSFVSGGGQAIDFVKDGNDWKIDAASSLYESVELTNPTGNDWELKTFPSESVWKFDGQALSGYPDTEGRITSIEDRHGNELTLNYTSGRISSIEEPTGRTISLAYNNSGLLESVQDPNGNTTNLAYDSQDRLTDVSGPEGCTTSFTYDSNDLITGVTDARSNTTSYAYTQLSGETVKRVQSITESGSNPRQLTYAYSTATEDTGYDSGQRELDVTQVSLSPTSTFEYRFDSAGNLWRSITPLGTQTNYVWSDQQRLLSVSEGYPSGHKRTTNGTGPKTNNNNRSLRRTVNDEGFTIAEMDATGLITTFTYDENVPGRLTSVHPQFANQYIQGNWTEFYGKDGYLLCAADENGDDIYEAPSYLNGSPLNGSGDSQNPMTFVKHQVTGDFSMDPRTPVQGDGSLAKRVGFWKQSGADAQSVDFQVRLSLSESKDFNLSLYTHSADLGQNFAIPFEYKTTFGRNLEFEVEDLNGVQTYHVHNNAPGLWMTFPVKGDAANPIKVTVRAKEFNERAVLSAIAFDPHQDRRTLYEYNPAGLVSKVTSGDGGETKFTYESNGTLANIEDPLGNITQFKYLDANKNLTQVLNDKLEPTDFEYDLNGNLTKVTTTRGGVQRSTTMTYDGKNRPLTTTDPLGNTTQTQYDGNGNITKVIDALGRETNLEYSANNRLLSVEDPLGHKFTVEYNQRGQVAKTIDPRGFVTETIFDEDGQVREVKYPDGESVRYSHDALRRLVAVTGPNGTQDTAAAINLIGADNLFRNPDLEIEANDRGKARSWDRRGGTSNLNPVQHEWDENESFTGSASLKLNSTIQRSLQKKIDLPIGGEYLALLHAKNIADIELEVESYDVDGRIVSVSEQQSLTGGASSWVETEPFRFSIDGKSQTAPNFPSVHSFTIRRTSSEGLSWLDNFRLHPLSTTFKYDREGRSTEVTLPDGSKSQLRRDQFGRVVLAVDSLGRETKFRHDELDRIVEITTPTGETQKMSFDLVGNLKTLVDGRGEVTNYEYDELNRLVKTTYPDLTDEVLTYDDVGNLATSKDINQVTMTFGYDSADRLISIDYSTGQLPISLTYDAVSNVLSSSERNGDLTQYTYDAANRMITQERIPVSGSLTPGWKHQYKYDANGNRTKLSEGDTPTVLWEVKKPNGVYGVATYGASKYADEYDSMGRLTQFGDENANQASYSYDVEGRRTGITRPNDINTQAEYDMVGRLLGLETSDSSSSLLSTSYTYDRNSQRQSQLVGNDGFDYQVDSEGRLIGESVNCFVDSGLESLSLGGGVGVTAVNEKLELLEINDDFSGEDLNSDRWKIGYLTGSATYSIETILGYKIRQQDGLHFGFPIGYSNRTHHTKDYGSTIKYDLPTGDQPVEAAFGYYYDPSWGLVSGVTAAVTHRVQLTGDFDVQMGFHSHNTVGNGQFATESKVTLTLTKQLLPDARSSSSSTEGVAISQTSGASVEFEPLRGGSIVSKSVVDNSFGELRLVRASGTITAYHKDSATGNWVTEPGWSVTGMTEPLWVSLLHDIPQQAAGSVTFDYFRMSQTSDYLTSASFDSVVYDAGRSVTWDNVSWTENLPSGADVTLQVATSNSPDGPWTYLGPDGTVNTSFATSTGQSVGTAVTGQYARYRAELTGNGLATPSVPAVKLTYTGDIDSRDDEFVYDDAGNMVTRTSVSSSGTTTETRSYNDLNELTSNSIVEGATTTLWNFSYDANGNLTQKTDGTKTFDYVWDDQDRLIEVKEDSVSLVTYEYDDGNRMLLRIENGIATRFHWDGWTLIRTEKQAISGGAYTGPILETTKYYAPQGEVHSFERDGELYFLHGDGLSSTQMVTDSNGVEKARIVYGAWGEELSVVDNVPGGLDCRFVGGLGVRTDLTTGLVYMRNRWYDSTLQRFISRDPIGYAGGTNLYEYSMSNPASYVDVMGLVGGSPFYGDGAQYGAGGQIIPNRGPKIGRNELMFGLGVLPVVGTAIGIAEFVAAPTLAGAGGLALSAIPGGKIAGKIASKVGGSRAGRWLAKLASKNKKCPTPSGGTEVALDTNILIDAFERGRYNEVAGLGIPVVSPQAVREFAVEGNMKKLADFLKKHSGRVGAVDDVNVANQLRWQSYLVGRNLDHGDYRVIASAMEDGLKIITRDGDMLKFLKKIKYPNGTI